MALSVQWSQILTRLQVSPLRSKRTLFTCNISGFTQAAHVAGRKANGEGLGGGWGGGWMGSWVVIVGWWLCGCWE